MAGAFGVKGEVRITAYTDDPLSLLTYGRCSDADGAPALTLTAGRAAKGALIARATPPITREEAEALRGLELYVPREALPPPDEDEFYLADLIGLAVRSPAGEPLGRIKWVQNFGAGDLLEIDPADGGPTWWLPFTGAGPRGAHRRGGGGRRAAGRDRIERRCGPMTRPPSAFMAEGQAAKRSGWGSRREDRQPRRSADHAAASHRGRPLSPSRGKDDDATAGPAASLPAASTATASSRRHHLLRLRAQPAQRHLALLGLAAADDGDHRDLGQGVLAHLVADLLVAQVGLDAQARLPQRAPRPSPR